MENYTSWLYNEATFFFCCCCLVAQSYPTLCDLMDCSPPVSSVQEDFQARILEQFAISFSMGFSQPRDWTGISCIASGFFTTESPAKILLYNLSISLHLLFLKGHWITLMIPLYVLIKARLSSHGEIRSNFPFCVYIVDVSEIHCKNLLLSPIKIKILIERAMTQAT